MIDRIRDQHGPALVAFALLLMPSGLHGTPVPLTIQAVNQGAFTPTRRTILNLTDTEGSIIRKVVPDLEGTTKIYVEPGEYLLFATGGVRPSLQLKIEVLPPETTVTIQISASGASALVSYPRGRGNASSVKKPTAPEGSTSSVQEQLWVGLGLLLLLLISLIVAFFKPVLTADQRTILRFVSAVYGGFAGAFITGDALFKMTGKTTTSEYAISGAAGFALVFVIWIFFPRVSDNPYASHTRQPGRS